MKNFYIAIKNKGDRRTIILIPGIEKYADRRKSGSDWLIKGTGYDRRSGFDRRISNN